MGCPYFFIFDLDNTLIYTDIANNMAYKEAIQVVLNIGYVNCDIQRITRIELANMLPECSQEQLSKIVLYKENIYPNYYDQTTLNTNLLKILVLLHTNRCETILLTECRRNRAIALCEYHGLMNYFSQCYFLENYNGKSKYCFLYKLGITAADCVLFENGKKHIQNDFIKIPESNIIQIKI